jgi:hypothetical protein
VATWADVRRLALDLPGAREDASGNTTAWRVGSKAFAWERHLRKHELALLGESAPHQPALGLRVADPGARAAWLQQHPGVFFLVPFYEPHPMVLVRVEEAPFEVLDDALTEAWLSRAPQRLVRPFLAAVQAP